MRILWTDLRPHGRLAAPAPLLAAVGQVLALVGPVVFGTIIDQFTTGRSGKGDDALVAGMLRLLALAVLVAVLSRLAKALLEYLTRLVVQTPGTSVFSDRLRHLLRLTFQEFEALRSDESLSLRHKVRADSERYISAFVNTAFAATVGIGFMTLHGQPS